MLLFLLHRIQREHFFRELSMEAEHLILFHVKTSSTYDYVKGKEDYV